MSPGSYDIPMDLSVKTRRKIRLEEFLRQNLDHAPAGRVIQWVRREEGVFRILWTHQSSGAFTHEDAALFRYWALARGKPSNLSPVDLKQSLRMALNKSPSVKRVQAPHDEYRYFRFTDWDPEVHSYCHSSGLSYQAEQQDSPPLFPTPPFPTDSHDCLERNQPSFRHPLAAQDQYRYSPTSPIYPAGSQNPYCYPSGSPERQHSPEVSHAGSHHISSPPFNYSTDVEVDFLRSQVYNIAELNGDIASEKIRLYKAAAEAVAAATMAATTYSPSEYPNQRLLYDNRGSYHSPYNGTPWLIGRTSVC